MNQNFNPLGINQVWVSDITYRVPGVQGEHGRSNEPRVCLEY
ncbi:transposase Tra5 [Yersinia pestis PY-34]|nr:putative transposase, truncation [Yersinia pestis Angola]EIR41204.1 transposase Tra5 [Yersinia pestis PY-11]EIR84409.1 transposase Tra5 [Yersinia pestis PY-34]